MGVHNTSGKRYDPARDPLAWYRTQAAPGRPGTYAVGTCRVCGGRYRPRAYGAHAKTPAHRAKLR